MCGLHLKLLWNANKGLQRISSQKQTWMGPFLSLLEAHMEVYD